jgi:outer membrane protein TolC
MVGKLASRWQAAFCAVCALVFVVACTGEHAVRHVSAAAPQHLPARASTDISRPEPVDFDQTITLPEAIRIALANNPDSRMAIARVREAEAALLQTQSVFYPTVGFYTEYLQGDAPSAYLFKTIDQRDLPPDVDFNDPGWFENWESGLKARWNLYNGGRDRLDRKISENSLEISRLDRGEIENTLASSVSRTFFDALAALEFIRIAEESVVTVETQLELMQVRHRGGSALKSDLLSLEVRLAEAREAVVSSRNHHRTLQTVLATLLGLSPDVELALEKSAGSELTVPLTYEEALALALRQRPDLKKIREQLDQSQLRIEAARSGYLPSVDVIGRYYFDDSRLSYDFDRRNWTAAILLNWEIFGGFRTRAETHRAEAAFEALQEMDRKTLLAVKREVRNACLNLEETVARLAVVRKSVASAEESLRLVRIQYEGGSATITRYLEAELDRNRAKMRAAAALFDHRKAVYDIGRAVGHWAWNVQRSGSREGE